MGGSIPNNSPAYGDRTRKPKTKITTRKLTLPRKITDSRSLELVASPLGPIQTYTICTLDRDILLDRLRVEIIDKFHFSLASPSSSTTVEGPSAKSNHAAKRKKNGISSDNSTLTKRQRQQRVLEKDNTRDPSTSDNALGNNSVPTNAILQNDMIFQAIRKRIVVGSNQCTRALELARKVGGVALPSLVMLARDVRPPVILAHIPHLCRLLQIPLLLLPGNASSDMGKLFGVKTISILIFLDEGCSSVDNPDKEQKQCHKQIDSYVTFAKTKVNFDNPRLS